jgi:hypothetical protein
MLKFNLQFFGDCDMLKNYGVNLEIDITPESSPTWVELGAGINNLAEALNEVINDYQFLNKNGFGQSEVTGMQPVWTLSGVRQLDDAAQNYIFSKKYELGCNRKTNVRINYLNGDGDTVNIIYNNVTLANLQEFGGGSTDGAAISIEIKTSEKPVVTGADLIGNLSVVSLGGASAGDTALYINPVIEGGNIYKIQLASTVDDLTIPTYGQDMTALTTWNGTDEITAATGTGIMVVECTGAGLARKAGKVVVIAA